MKEYCILQQIGEGKMWRSLPYPTFDECEQSLYFMLERFKGRVRKNYYVDNDFFNNHTDVSAHFYYCIEEREVSNWKKYYRNVSNRNNILKFLN